MVDISPPSSLTVRAERVDFLAVISASYRDQMGAKPLLSLQSQFAAGLEEWRSTSNSRARYLGGSLTFDDQADLALAAIEKSLRINPRDPFNNLCFVYAAVAHFSAGRYSEGAASAREAIQQRPDNASAHRLLAACAAEMGNAEEAGLALTESKRLQPGLSIAWLQANHPVRQQRVGTRFIAAMRRAGLE